MVGYLDNSYFKLLEKEKNIGIDQWGNDRNRGTEEEVMGIEGRWWGGDENRRTGKVMGMEGIAEV